MGVVLIVALLIGSSATRGLISTTIVQILALALLPAAVDWSRPSAYWPAVTALVVAGLALIVLQLLPLGSVFALHPEANAQLGLPAPLAWTTVWERTAEALLFVGPSVLIFLVLGRFDENGFNRLLPFLYLGVLANVVFALVQFAARAGAELSPGYLPYEAAAGFFANQNHFATLMFVGIPLVVYQFVVIKKPLWSLAAIAVFVLACFATRSVAGVFLSLGCALVSYAFIGRVSARWRIGLVLLALVGVTALAFNPANILQVQADDPLDRMTIWRNTIAGIEAYLPLGSGFGTFDLIYPQFETVADVQSSFINHAHNEFLELLLEGGIPAAALLLLYLGLIVAAMLRLPYSPLRWAALCGLGFVLIHSAVDYPLRNISMALIFAVLNAIVFSRNVGAAQT